MDRKVLISASIAVAAAAGTGVFGWYLLKEWTLVAAIGFFLFYMNGMLQIMPSRTLNRQAFTAGVHFGIVAAMLAWLYDMAAVAGP